MDSLSLIPQTQGDKHEMIPVIKSTISCCYYTLNNSISLYKVQAGGDFDLLRLNLSLSENLKIKIVKSIEMTILNF